ncbi:aldo/keto reductase [Bariatricus massiliensis]|uniref:Aldo/keto reductase n=1 Tax=Bariatricus massiliensis TaxID=1745713 RepID=A0ABS8DGB3_9FIRM|nr:aldo/keto reductase [Bariatricus massiliensis]MCB7304042.1 aldo/keto reductase [Bariatricus massiliensis]MCB7374527.1 aldo/keto reductase [Bariatricus massiliensis]MCB7387152.1 aldo/keto reductase [Bariatricus massiliensis]MCB7411314.1 aldo/keto reductase [Bariatricus massiliensis]MCQ5252740.1 aldo/keto reductase [Bariatricus massiliensis]
MKQTYITLNDGNKIPQFGMGVYMVPEGRETYRAVLEALTLGYRHIDTAHAYQNERSVGAAVRESRISREEIWITTKLWPSEYGEGKTAAAIDKMLSRLDTGYIDLLLLHQQFGDYLGAWKDMEKAVEAGKVRSIGISNFESERLEELCEAAVIKPAVLQVECHPYYQQNALKERIAPYGTVIESWYPIGHGDEGLINESVFTTLGKKYGKSNVQIILRWHIQEGNIIFPKSANPQHIRDNFDIFDFELTPEEMDAVRAVDKGERFFNMSLAEQEANLGQFVPAD